MNDKMVMELEMSQRKEEKKLSQKSFAELKLGDNITALAEITQIQHDEKNTPPAWVLFYLYDGTSTIRLFRNRNRNFEVGDVVIIDLDIREGKPFKNKPQLAYRANFMRKIDKSDPRYTSHLQNLRYKGILWKSDIQALPDGTRIKIFTRILNLHPNNGVKEKYQKVIIADLENKPISLWFPKECFPIFESIEEREYFVLKAIVKTIEHNMSARFLSFDTYIQGKDAYKDSIARQFFEEQISYYSQELNTYLKLWKTYVSKPNERIDMLLLMIGIFRRDMYQ
ncbi:MAG: hypothetical protein HWN66_12280 [Candidatus Helarchaeota archaeon]|nr:hypothetical protein [Candidatus Helarchaeota archaeon]